MPLSRIISAGLGRFFNSSSQTARELSASFDKRDFVSPFREFSFKITRQPSNARLVYQLVRWC